MLYAKNARLERRNTPPGPHATGKGKRRAKVSDRGMQLMEKQKAKYTYGMIENVSSVGFSRKLPVCPGITGANLLVLLERRLDNVVFRLGFADSRSQARQLVRHGHIKLNGRKTNVPSCLVKADDLIEWRKESTKNEFYKVLVEKIEDKDVPSWLALDKGNMTGKVISLPGCRESGPTSTKKRSWNGIPDRRMCGSISFTEN